MRVLEIAEGVAAPYAGKLLTRYGADVVAVSPPDVDPLDQALDIYLNGGKRRVQLDYTQPEGVDLIARLAARSDIVIADAAPESVEALGLLDIGRPDAPRVSVSITPFGMDGPYRDYAATAPVLMALSGHTFLMGDPGREPLTMPGNYPWYQAGTIAYVAALAAWLPASSDPARPPEAIEISVFECLASLHQFTEEMWTHAGIVRSRHGNRWENLHPTGLLPCADGWWSVNVLDQFWEGFCHFLGRPELIDDPRFATNAARMERADEFDAIVIAAVAEKTMRQVLREGQEQWRVPVGYRASMQDVLDEPHLAERGFWQPVRGPGGSTLQTAGSPYRFDGETPPIEQSVVAHGADTDAVLAALEAQ